MLPSFLMRSNFFFISVDVYRKKCTTAYPTSNNSYNFWVQKLVTLICLQTASIILCNKTFDLTNSWQVEMVKPFEVRHRRSIVLTTLT